MTFLIFKSSLKPDEEAIDFEQFEAETEPTSPKFLAFNLLEWAVERQANGLFISDEEHSVSIDIRRLRRVAHVQTLTRDHGDRIQGHARVLVGGDPDEMQAPPQEEEID